MFFCGLCNKIKAERYIMALNASSFYEWFYRIKKIINLEFESGFGMNYIDGKIMHQ